MTKEKEMELHKVEKLSVHSWLHLQFYNYTLQPHSFIVLYDMTGCLC